MKIFAFILSIIVATALLFGGAFLIVLAGPQHDAGFTITSTIAILLFVYGSLTLGSLTAYWDVTNSADSRKYYRRWLIAVAAIDFVAAVVLIIFGIHAHTAIWLVATLVIAGALLLVIAPAVGNALNRYDRKHRPESDAVSSWTPITRGEIARKVRAIAITFVITFVVGLVGFVILGHFTDHRLSQVGVELSFAAQFAFLGAAIACLANLLPLNRRLRESVTRDIGLLRKVGRVVLRGKPVELDREEQIAAVKYAVIISITLPFTLVSVGLIYASLGISQVRSVLDGRDDSSLSLGTLAAYVALIVVMIPIYVTRIRRARRYAHDHADLLPTGNPSQLLAETDR